MAEGEEEIVSCYACGAPMNIAAFPPYSRVVCPSCQTQNRVKAQFGHYVVNRRHAIGGMSSVFIAKDSTLDREVALKILSEEYSSDAKRISAFEDEARLTASFSHPNVVSVFTTGKAFGRLYIAMEFVPGGHFEHHIRERVRIPEIEALPLAIQVAEGLQGAQAAGLIHRDVKPGNILLDSEGNAKLVDFGLALVTKAGLAKATEIWATPYYVPPEAIEGRAEDFRADIYAFGATFYHALAGKPPCNEESMSTSLLREAKKHIVPLKKAAPDLSPETCAVIDRAMAFDPIHRFSSYDEMLSALHAALKAANDGLLIDAEGVSKSQRRLEQQKKKKINAILSGATAAVLLTAAVVWIKMINQTASPPPSPKPAVIALDATQSNEEDDLHRIAQIYQTARSGMERGELPFAEQHFAKLLENHEVQEPTRTWAGLEAVVVAMMDGRMNDARMHANRVKDHIHQTPSLSTSEFHTKVLPILEKLSEPAFIKTNDFDFSSKSREAYMAALMAGLKNWEQGGLDQSLPFLKILSYDTSLSEDNVLAWYQDSIKGYLGDYEKMQSPAFLDDPKNPESCRQAVAELDKLSTLLETKGRARFMILARQLDLRKLEHTLSQPVIHDPIPTPIPVNKLKAGEELLSEISLLAKDYRFEEIVSKLEKFDGTLPGCERSSLLAVSQASLNLLSEIEADLNESAVILPLTLKDGTPIISLVVKDDILYSKLKTEKVREIRWIDLGVDQIIKLNAELIKRLTAKADREQRNTSAIALDWLSGNRTRAMITAENLAEKSSAFKKHWDAVSPGLPK